MITNDFLQSQNILGGSVGFVDSSPKKLRIALTLTLVTGFIVLCWLLAYYEYSSNSISGLFTIKNPKQNQFISSIDESTIRFALESNIDLSTRNCFMQLKASFNQKLYANIFNFSLKRIEENKFLYEVNLSKDESKSSESAANNAKSRDFFNSEIFYTCLHQSSYDYLRSNAIFQFSLMGDLRSINPLNKLEPFAKIGEESKFVFNSNPSIFPSHTKFSWTINLKPVTVVDDDNYFSLASFNIDNEISKSDGQSTENTKLVYYRRDRQVIDSIIRDSNFKTEVLGYLNFHIDFNGDIVARQYPKFFQIFPSLLCIFVLFCLLLRLLFNLIDSNLKYIEYVNSFYSLTFAKPGSKEAITPSITYSFKDKLANMNGSSGIHTDVSTLSKSGTLTENTENTLKKNHKKPLLEATFMQGEYAQTEAISKMSSSKNDSSLKIKEKAFVHYSLNNSSCKSSEVNIEGLSEPLPCDFTSTRTLESFKFGALDVINFMLCFFLKKVKVKKNLYENCKNQLKYFLSPHFYFSLCAFNEEKLTGSQTPRNIYSASIDFEANDFQIDRKSETKFSKAGNSTKANSEHDIEFSYEYRY